MRGTPKRPVVQEGKFFLATPIGPTEPVDLKELLKQFKDGDLCALKAAVDTELQVRMHMTQDESERRGREL